MKPLTAHQTAEEDWQVPLVGRLGTCWLSSNITLQAISQLKKLSWARQCRVLMTSKRLVWDNCSGQPKQSEAKICRNQNKCLRKAEASAKTEASAETFISAEIHCFGQTIVSASQFILFPSLFWTQTDWEQYQHSRSMLERGREIENQWFTKHPLLAETVILAETASFSQKMCFGRIAKREESRKAETETYFGRNRTETVFSWSLG